jgi:hypothetical protein
VLDAVFDIAGLKSIEIMLKSRDLPGRDTHFDAAWRR